MQITSMRKKFAKNFEIRNLGKYNDLYVHSDKLLLADAFEKIWNMSLKVYILNSTRFFLLLN